VAVRGYIATLRADIKDLEAKVLVGENVEPDPHAHYHGHELCTNDHGDDEHAAHAAEKKEKVDEHAGHDHGHGHEHHEKKEEEEHKHDSNCAPSCGHDHGHAKEEHGHAKEEHDCGHDHDHGHDHHEKKKEEHEHDDHGHAHGHEHAEKKEEVHEHDHHGHGHAEHEEEKVGKTKNSHDHAHGHEHADKKDDTPAWKKKAMESGASDPMAAPFGGDWNVESNISASGKSDKMEE
jgi:hypothetical protein